MASFPRNPELDNSTETLRETAWALADKIVYQEARGVDQSDRRARLAAIATELLNR